MGYERTVLADRVLRRRPAEEDKVECAAERPILYATVTEEDVHRVRIGEEDSVRGRPIAAETMLEVDRVLSRSARP